MYKIQRVIIGVLATAMDISGRRFVKHCDVNFENLDTWFLKDIEGFKNRNLMIGKCPNCKKIIVILRETSIADGIIFENIQKSEKAEKIIKRERKRIIYTSRQHNSYSGSWIFGVNTEVKHKVGEKKGQINTVRQYSYDYATNKSRGMVKQIKV